VIKTLRNVYLSAKCWANIEAMSTAAGLVIAFALIAFGGVGLAAFAIMHCERLPEDSGSNPGSSR
jgi:hypothetical protein